MNRIDRLFGILTSLQSKKHLTGAELADRYQISVRTVYRDIKSLNEMGIPVGFEPPRGYFIVQGYFLPPLTFSANEANSLLLVASLAEKFTDQSVALHSQSAVSKIKAVLRPEDKQNVNLLTDQIKIHIPKNEGASNNHLAGLQAAIASQKIIGIDYTDANNMHTTREIEPLGLVFYNMQWHLIAWCWKRLDNRDFKVKQISRITHTGQPYRKKDNISLNQFLSFLE